MPSKAEYWANRARLRATNKVMARLLKLEVTSQYGPDGDSRCSWPGCQVDDLDILTVDHIDNSGASDKRKGKASGGYNLYVRLKREKFPPGFQTLCHNHQWKKEVLRRRLEGRKTILYNA